MIILVIIMVLCLALVKLLAQCSRLEHLYTHLWLSI